MMAGKELEMYRLLLGLTREQAGNLMYLTRQQVYNIEKGRSKQESTRYLMELCYDMYRNEHKDEFKNRLNEMRKSLDSAVNAYTKLTES